MSLGDSPNVEALKIPYLAWGTGKGNRHKHVTGRLPKCWECIFGFQTMARSYHGDTGGRASYSAGKTRAI